MPIVVSAIANALHHFEEQTGHEDSIQNGADSIEAPSILSSGLVAAGGSRTTRYGRDGQVWPFYQYFRGRSGRSRTTKDNRGCRVMAPRAGFEPATIRLTVTCSTGSRSAESCRADRGHLKKFPGLEFKQVQRGPVITYVIDFLQAGRSPEGAAMLSF